MNKIVCVGLLFGIVTGIACAGEIEPLIINVDGRSTISLDGKWRSIIDPVNKGYLDWEYKPPQKKGFNSKKVGHYFMAQ